MGKSTFQSYTPKSAEEAAYIMANPSQASGGLGELMKKYALPAAGAYFGAQALAPYLGTMGAGVASDVGSGLLTGGGGSVYDSLYADGLGGVAPDVSVPDAYGMTMRDGTTMGTTNTPSGNWWDSFLPSVGSAAGSAAGAAAGSSGLGALASAGLGALVGSQDGSKQTGTQTVTQEPWSAQQPYLQDLFKQAQGVNSVQGTGMNPLQTQAITDAGNAGNATAGWFDDANPIVGKNAYAGSTNPYLQQSIDYANEDVTRAMMPALNQANHASGSFGNSGVAETYGRAMTDQYGRNANTARMNDYTQQINMSESDVGRKFSAAMNAPTLNNQTLQNAQNKFNLGGMAQSQPYDALKNYGSLITGNYGSTTNSPIYQNTAGGLLGGAAIGSSIYQNIFK